jgi:hypothetical protein
VKARGLFIPRGHLLGLDIYKLKLIQMAKMTDGT